MRIITERRRSPSNEGSDDNSGTEEAPVKTFARAKELLATDGTIYIIDGMLTVSDSQSWSLEGYGQATVKRAAGSTIVELTEGASLTLEHIILDGGIDVPDPDRSGGSLITSDEECTLVLGDGCVLRNNSCNSHGAAVAGWEKMHLTMKPGAVIENNYATDAQYGGAVFLANESVFEMEGGEIKNNTANRGGGIALIGSEMTMSGGTISGNAAKSTQATTPGIYGGAIYISDYEEQSGLPGENAIHPYEVSFTMTGGTISGNSAEEVGGAILSFPQGYRESFSQDITIDIQNGTITDNTAASSNGGGIALYYSQSHLKISGGSISQNKAPNALGGGIFLYEATDAEVAGGNIRENQAKSGGGMYLWDSRLELSDGSILENKAIGGSGGGIYVGDDSMLAMTGGQISQNSTVAAGTTQGQGGALYVGFDATAKITGGTISGNTAAIHLDYKEGNECDYDNTFSNGISLSGFLQFGGNAQINPQDDIGIYSSDYATPSFVEVIDTAWNNNGNKVSITSQNAKIPKYTVEDGDVAGTKLVSYNSEQGAVNDAYREVAQKADADGVFVPSAAMLEVEPTLRIGQSEISTTTNILTYKESTSELVKWEYPSSCAFTAFISAVCVVSLRSSASRTCSSIVPSATM